MATGSSVINPVVQLLSDVIEVINNNDDNPQTLQIDLRAVEILVQDLAALFRGQQQAPPEIVMFWLQLLQNSLSQVKRLLNRRLGRGQRFVDCVVCKPRRFSKEVTYWNSFFNHLYHGFQGDLSILLTSLHFLSTKPIMYLQEDATGSGRIRDAQRLSEDDGWMLFRRVAFKEEHVSMDIEDRGRLIAAECKGMPLAINMVAAAMIGQRSVDEWDNCLSSIVCLLNLSGCSKITSIPTSVGQLRQLEFLSLSGLSITDLPPEISHLSKLQFLNLSHCMSLVSLPSQIGELKNLKHLNLWDCSSLKTIPREISQLTSLCRLQMWTDLSVEMEAPASIWSLKGLKNLTELAVYVDKGSGIKDGIMGTWSEMRHLKFNYPINASQEDLPQDIQNMKKLQSLMLYRYRGLNLPNCKFAHLEMVRLYYCTNIRELSPLERLPNLKILKLYDSCSELRELGIGSGGSVGYPRLQKLVLRGLEKFESLCGASNRGVWDEGTLPHLRVLKIHWCPSLKRFPSGMEKLQNLSALVCSKDQWESMMWEDDNMRVKLQNILKHPY